MNRARRKLTQTAPLALENEIADEAQPDEEAVHPRESRKDCRDAEHERQQKSRERVADQTSKKLTQTAFLLLESEVRDEVSRTNENAAFPGEQRLVHPDATLWVGADGSAAGDGGTVCAGTLTVERVAGPVCVVCGQGGGMLVRMVDRPVGGHTRAPP